MADSRFQILVVDDVQSVRIQVRELLRASGYDRVKTASNGMEALRMLHEHQFDAVIADWYMNPLDGLELLKEIRAKKDFDKVAFLLLTAESTREKVLDAISRGVDDYIMKPFTQEHAQLKLTKALIKRGHI